MSNPLVRPRTDSTDPADSIPVWRIHLDILEKGIMSTTTTSNSNTPKATRRQVHQALLATVAAVCLAGGATQAFAESADDLNRESAQALQALYEKNPAAAAISKKAKAVLVFPKVIKAGLVFGGSYGEGVLMESNRVVDYYNTVSASWGWQAGAEAYSYVVFLMNDKAVRYLRRSKGWEFGVGPSIVAVNEGVARNLSTTTLKDDAYAFIFDQQGLMASLSIEGTKVTRIKR
jgi:lipid-binding SYLF domain-containing protein